MSNLAKDITDSDAGTLLRTSNVFVDFMTAIDRAKELVAPYTTKKTGEPVTVTIFLYKGEHFVLNKRIEKYSSTLK